MITKVLAILLLVQLIFSLWPVFIKLLIEKGFPSVEIAIFRDIFATFLLWLMIIVTEGAHALDIWKKLFNSLKGSIGLKYTPDFEVLDRSNASSSTPIESNDNLHKILIFLGIASCLNSVGFVLALDYITAFNSALLHPIIPVFATIFGIILGVESMSSMKVFGTFLCIFGSIVVVTSQSNQKFSGSYVGNILLLIQSLAVAALLVGQKLVHPRRFSSLHLTAIYYSLGTIFSIIPCTLYLWSQKSFQWLSGESVGIILFGSVFVISFNYAALTWANKVSSPTTPASSMMLQPPLTYLLAYIIQGKEATKEVTWLELMGGLSISVGLVLTLSFPSGALIRNDIDLEDKSSEDENDGILLNAINNQP